MNIVTYLKQPYPFYYEELKRVFLFLCLIAVASFLFTYLFEPFIVNVEEHKIHSLLIIVFHSVIPIPIAFAYFFYLKKSVKDVEKWTLGKEFLHLAVLLFLIGLASFLIRDFIYTNPDNWSFRYLWEEIRNTFLVGSLLLIIILPLNRERLVHKHISNSKKLSPHQESTEFSNTVVQIKTPILEERFDLAMHAFLYAKVDSNYLEVFFKSANGIEKQVKRLPLKDFEAQLHSFPFVFKVHRSYIVNLYAIQSISGNAQGYELHLKGYSQKTIPVSRSKIETFNQLYTGFRNKTK